MNRSNLMKGRRKGDRGDRALMEPSGKTIPGAWTQAGLYNPNEPLGYSSKFAG